MGVVDSGEGMGMKECETAAAHLASWRERPSKLDFWPASPIVRLTLIQEERDVYIVNRNTKLQAQVIKNEVR